MGLSDVRGLSYPQRVIPSTLVTDGINQANNRETMPDDSIETEHRDFVFEHSMRVRAS